MVTRMRALSGAVVIGLVCAAAQAEAGEPTTLVSKFLREARALAFSPDGKTLAVGGEGNVLELWDVTTGKSRTFAGPTRVGSLVFTPDGKALAVASGSGPHWGIALLDVATWKQLALFSKVTNFTHGECLALSRDGKRLAGVSGWWGGDVTTITLYDVKSRKPLAALKGHARNVESVAFSPDGTLLASGSRDETIKLWDVKTGKELATLKGEWGAARSVVFSPNGKLLASGHGNGVVKLWDVASRKESVPLRWRGNLADCNSVAFSPDGKSLAAACDTKVRWWDVSTGNELLALEGHTRQVVSVAFSPDGNLLASGSIDRTIKLWKIADRKGKGK